MSKVLTNNSYLYDKIRIRLLNLPDKQIINVLDCYRGNAEIWKSIKLKSDKTINVLGIDKEKDYDGIYLQGENLKFLKTLDLNKFDIIDLDAYGIPYKQLELIFERKFKGIIFVTFIQSVMGAMNKKLLIRLGYTENMYKKCPTLLSRNGFEKFKAYLFLNGISEINSLSYDRKHYLTFKIN